MDQDQKKKRTRDQGEEQGMMKHFPEKKHAKIRQDQRQCYTNDIISGTSSSDGSPDHHDSGVAVAEGVFDFPWLKDGIGVAKYSDEWKFEELEDTFMSQLGATTSTSTTTTITTPAGIEFSFPGQCLCQIPVEAVLEFPEEKFDEEKFDKENNECPLLENDAFDTCIWGA